MAKITIDFTYHRVLLRTAEAQVDESQYPIAVLTAQMAFEVRVEAAFAALIPLRVDLPADAIQDLVTDRTFMARPVRNLWTALTGDEINKAPAWKAYQAHVERRNRLAHGREEWSSRAHAEESVRAVRQMIEHVDRAQRRATASAKRRRSRRATQLRKSSR